MTTTVNVVEALCGAGKSHWAFTMMRERPEERWIFVTPFLDEAGDDDSGLEGTIRQHLPDMHFRTPSAKVTESKRKSDHLLLLTSKGDNISMTHNLFLSIDEAILKQIDKHNYNIVIDETIEKVEIHAKLNDKVDDIKDLITNGYIVMADNGKLDWVGNKLHAYSEEYELCKEGRLFLFNDRLLVKKHSSMVYELAKEVYVLTYMFHASPMRVWFQANGIKWNYLTPKLYRSTEERKQTIRSLIRFEKNEDWILALQGKTPQESTAFSSTWFKKDIGKKSLEKMRDHANKLYRRWTKRQSSPPKIMFTVFKAYADHVAGLGTRSEDYMEPESAFIAKNSRATNKHKSRDHVIYWVNVFPNVDVQMYLNSLVPKKDGLSSDDYALSEMIQWVFRSALRDDKPITIYISSERMKKLFQDWLNKDE